MNCPSCQRPATALTLDGHLGRAVEIDVCPSCQAFWFDHRESLQLTPAGTLTLFRVIGEGAPAARQPIAAVVKCPRCSSQLVATHDRQRNVAFQYRRCPHGHGRLTTFYDFLREKDFIRPVSAAQLAELRQTVQSVHCSNCGAPVDLAKTSACAHCRSPLSLLDLKQAGALIEQLQQADSRPLDPALPLRLAQARREVDAAFARMERQPSWLGATADTDLVGARPGHVGALAQRLKRTAVTATRH